MKSPINFLKESDFKDIPTTKSYNCPNCGKFSTEQRSMIGMTKSTFEEFPDPHYSWKEKHKCENCETIYQFNNGT